MTRHFNSVSLLILILIYPSHFISESILALTLFMTGCLVDSWGFNRLFFSFSNVQGPLGLDGKPVSIPQLKRDKNLCFGKDVLNFDFLIVTL